MTSTDTAGQVEARMEVFAWQVKFWKEAAADRSALWDAINPRGPRCRDCGDEDGRCPASGLPCDPQEAALEILAARQSPAPATQAAGGGVVEALAVAYFEARTNKAWTDLHWLDRRMRIKAMRAALATLSPASKVQTAGDEAGLRGALETCRDVLVNASVYFPDGSMGREDCQLGIDTANAALQGKTQ